MTRRVGDIKLAQNFEVGSPIPIDGRFTVPTASDRDAIPSGKRYPGLPVWVEDENRRYELLTDLTTWRIIDTPDSINFASLEGSPTDNTNLTDYLSATYVPLSSLSDYQLVSEKGQADGYASLNSSGYIPLTQLASGSATSSTWLNGIGVWTSLSNPDITTALGFNPEDLAHKATDFSVLNNIKYPTTQAVQNLVNTLVTGVSSFNTRVGAITLLSADVIGALSFTPENIANKGIAGGYVPLDGTGKVSTTYLPSSVLGDVKYKGTWNANTNIVSSSDSALNGFAIPSASSGNEGYYFIVSTPGTTTVDGQSDWKTGDWIVSNGALFEKIDNTDLVTSVNGYVGAVTLTKSDVGLSNVENTTLSTWAGTSNIITLGTVTTGVWNGTAIGDTYISSAASWNSKEPGAGNPVTNGYIWSSTTAGVRSWINGTSVILTGYTSGTGVISGTDTILSAIQKLNGNTAALVTGVSTVFGRSGTVTATSGDYNTSQVTENTNLYYTSARFDSSFSGKTTDNLTEGSGNLYITPTRVRGTVLTGYVSGAGAISSTDTVLSAINKLNGNITAITSSQWTIVNTNDIYYAAGNVIIGVNGTPASKLHIIETSTATPRGILVDQIGNNTSGSRITMRKARGVFGTLLTISSGDALASWTASAYDGTNYLDAGKILVTSVGTIGTGRTPTTMQLQTMTDATTGVLTTALTLDQAQNAIFAGHLTVEGVTSTGATGTGKFVFSISPTFINATIADLSDNTKKYTWNLAGITTGNTRTVTAVDYSGTLVLSNGALVANRIPYYTSSGLTDTANMAWTTPGSALSINATLMIGSTSAASKTLHLTSSTPGMRIDFTGYTIATINGSGGGVATLGTSTLFQMDKYNSSGGVMLVGTSAADGAPGMSIYSITDVTTGITTQPAILLSATKKGTSGNPVALGANDVLFSIENAGTTGIGGGTKYFSIAGDGRTTIGNAGVFTAQLFVQPLTGSLITARLRAGTGQNVDILRVELASPTTVFTVDKNGLARTRAGSSTTQASIGGTVFDHITDTGNTDTSRDDLYSDSLPANIFVSNGDQIEVTYTIKLVASATATRELWVNFAGTDLFDTGALTISAPTFGSPTISIKVIITRDTATTVRYDVTAITNGATSGNYCDGGKLTGLTLTGATTLKISAQSTGVGAAANDIVAIRAKGTWRSAA